MRVAFIGCVEFSHSALRELLAHEDAEAVGVVTRSASRFNADFCSLAPLAEGSDVPVFLAEGNDQGAMARWLRERRPDVVYCFGWSYLLGAEILQVPPLGVIGYHPAALPQNRGRHPIIWALALGLPRTGSTFFFMDEGADSGDILSQRTVPIRYEDDARTLYDRLKATGIEQIREFTSQLSSGTYPRVEQDHGRANHWRKRSAADGRIDWRMSSRGIYNLVRALAEPYPGSHLETPSAEVKVWRVEEVGQRFPDSMNIEPGKVMEVEDAAFSVKCGSGVVRVVEWDEAYSPTQGSYLP